MKAICVDNDKSQLAALKVAVEKSPDITEVEVLDNTLTALDWVECHSFDVAFIEISENSMSSIELAEKLLALEPSSSVVFCSKHKDYAYDAFRIHASGYLLSPVSAEDIQRELTHIKGASLSVTPLTVRCFGSFEMYFDGIPISFKRSKTKEVFAYLVDRKGAIVSSREICAQLWEDEKQNLNYLHQLISDLRKGLKQLGAESVFRTYPQGYAVDVSLIECDYYRFLDGDTDAFNKFTGEYMSNYSWSEYTGAYLTSIINQK